MSDLRLDRVFTFGDQLSFLIPHEWVEADEEPDHYLYHAPNVHPGWLRVSLITLKGPGKATRDRLVELLTERAREEQGTLYESRDNIVVAWEEISSEAGDEICNYWWAVAHSAGTDLAREALFSYTVLLEQRQEPANQQTVALLGKLVADAKFQAPKTV